MWCWRQALRISWTKKVTNAEVLMKTKPGQSLLNHVKKHQLAYFGHVMRSQGNEKMLVVGSTKGKRRRGRQRMRWMDGVKEAARMNMGEMRDGWHMIEQRGEGIWMGSPGVA